MTQDDLDAIARDYAYLLLTDRPIRDLVTAYRAAHQVVKDSREVVKAAGELVRTSGEPAIAAPVVTLPPNAATRVAYTDGAFEDAIDELRTSLATFDQATGGDS